MVDYEPKPTKCPYCGGKVVLNRCRKEKSNSGFVYVCIECNSWVGTYPHDNTIAMGTLAPHQLRAFRVKVHRWFDKLWRNHKERQELYKKLAKEMGKEEVHIAQMSEEELEQALAIIKKWWWEKYDR